MLLTDTHCTGAGHFLYYMSLNPGAVFMSAEPDVNLDEQHVGRIGPPPTLLTDTQCTGVGHFLSYYMSLNPGAVFMSAEPATLT